MIDEVSGDLLQWLRGFYYVAMEGNIRLAALAMGREKPTISRQIKRLEQELGVILFDRSSGKMTITTDGEKLLEEARILFECVKFIKGSFAKGESQFKGKIAMAVSPAIVGNILPEYIDDFLKRFPETKFHITGGTRERILEEVDSSKVDFGICLSTGYEKSFQCYDFFESGSILIAPKNNSFFAKNKIPSLEEISKSPLIFLSHQGLSSAIEDCFVERDLDLNIVVTHNNHDHVKKFVRYGMGSSILASHCVSSDEKEFFDTYNLDEYFPRRKYSIVLKKKKYASPLIREFIKYLNPDIDLPSPMDIYTE